MKKPAPFWTVLSLFALATLSGSTLLGQDREGSVDLQERLVGAWRLVMLEEPAADGTPHPADCTGLLVFTRDGHMSAQVMYRNPAAGSAQYTQGGYEATFGTYEINARSRTFIYRVEGGLVRSLVGKELVRSIELSGKRMVVTSANKNEHWRVTWEHY